MSSSKEKQRLILESVKIVNPKFINFIGVISPGTHENHKTVYAVWNVKSTGSVALWYALYAHVRITYKRAKRKN